MAEGEITTELMPINDMPEFISDAEMELLEGGLKADDMPEFLTDAQMEAAESSGVVSLGKFEPDDYTVQTEPTRFSVFSDEEVKSFEDKGPITWDEASIRSHEFEALPFVGGVVAAVRVGKLFNAAKRFEKNEYEDESQKKNDEEKLMEYLKWNEEQSIRGYTRGARVYNGVTQLPGFMIEVAATMGVAAFGKSAVTKAITETAKKVAGEAVEKGIGKAAVGATAAVAGTAAGGALQGSVMVNRTVPRFYERQVAANVFMSDKGVAIYDKAIESPVTSAFKAWGEMGVEYSTELAGGTIFKPLGAIIGKKVAKFTPRIFIRTVRALQSKFPKVAAKYDVMTKAGYNGFIEEIGEERLGDIVRPLLGISEVGDNRDAFQQITESLTNYEQYVDEAILFSFPGATNFAAQRLHKHLQKRGMAAADISRTVDSLSQIEKESLMERFDTEESEIINEGIDRINSGEAVPPVVEGLIRGRHDEYVERGWVKKSFAKDRKIPIETKIKEIQFADKKQEDLKAILSDMTQYKTAEQVQAAYAESNLSKEEIDSVIEETGMLNPAPEIIGKFEKEEPVEVESVKEEPTTVIGKFEKIKARIDEIKQRRKDKKIEREESLEQVKTLKEGVKFLQDQRKEYKGKVKRFAKIDDKPFLDEEFNELPIYYRSSKGETLDVLASEAGFKTDMEFRDYLISLQPQVESLRKDIANIQEKSKPEAEEVVKQREVDHLKQRLSDFNSGIRKGQVSTRKDIKKLQQDLTDLIRGAKVLSKDDRFKFLPMIKNANSPLQLQKAVREFARRATQLQEAAQKRRIEKDIKKELKFTKPVKSGQRKKGKYDYGTNKLVKSLREFNKLTKGQAQELLEGFPAEGLTESDLIKKRMLSLKAGGKKSSVGMFNKVVNDIKTLKTAGEKAKNEEHFNKIVDKAFKIDELLSGIQRLKPGKKNALTKIVNVYRKGFSNIYSMLNSTFGKKIAEKYNSEIVESNRNDAIFFKGQEMSEEGARIFGVEDAYMMNDKLTEMAGEKFDLTDVDGLKTEISKLDLIDIYNSLKNKLTRERYYNSFGQDQIDGLMGYLTPKQIAFADYLQEEVQSYLPVLNARTIETTGEDLPTVDNYWPATSEFEHDFIDGIIMQGETASAQKARSKSSRVIPVPKNAWLKAMKHIAEAEHIDKVSRHYETLKRLFNDRLVKHQIIEKFGEDVYQVLNAQIDNLSLNAQSHKVDQVTEWCEGALNNWVVSKIALNPSVFVKQLISVGNYAENMKAADWVAGFAKGVATPKETFDFMWKNAPFLEARFNRGYSEASIEAIRGAEQMGEAWADWQKFLSSLVRGGDITAIIYGGAPFVRSEIAKNKAQGMSDKGALSAAFETFKQVTLQGQQSGLASSRSQFQNSRNAFARLYLAFKNTPNQYFRKMVDASISVSNGDISKAQFAKTMTIYAVIQPTLYASAGVLVNEGYKRLGDLLTGDDDSDNEELQEDLAEAILLQLAISPVSAIPLFNDIANFVARKQMGLRTWKVFSFPLIDDIASGIRSVNKKRVGALDYLNAAGSVLEVTTATPVKTYLRIFKKMFVDERRRR